MLILFDLFALKLVLPVILVLGVVAYAVLAQVGGYRSDMGRIRDEAESKDCKVLSIRNCWLPPWAGPFSWDERLPGCRMYRVQARERSEEKRTAYVLVGPRRLVSRWESWGSRRDEWYGTLTWRWEKRRHSTHE